LNAPFNYWQSHLHFLPRSRELGGKELLYAQTRASEGPRSHWLADARFPTDLDELTEERENRRRRETAARSSSSFAYTRETNDDGAADDETKRSPLAERKMRSGHNCMHAHKGEGERTPRAFLSSHSAIGNPTGRGPRERVRKEALPVSQCGFQGENRPGRLSLGEN